MYIYECHKYMCLEKFWLFFIAYIDISIYNNKN